MTTSTNEPDVMPVSAELCAEAGKTKQKKAEVPIVSMPCPKDIVT